MFEVVIEFFSKKDGKFAGMMKTALPYYFYDHDNDGIVDISVISLRKIVPTLPHEVHYLVRVA